MPDHTARDDQDDLAEQIAQSAYAPVPGVIRCKHVADDGRTYGWHHHEGPHACDAGNHGGTCPWWASRS